MAIIYQWKKFIPIIGIAFLGCSNLYINSKDLVKPPVLIDYFIYFSKGMDPFTNLGRNEVFKIPVIWMCLYLYIFYLIADYPVQDLKMLGKNLLIRSNTRVNWWISKCIITIHTIFICYFLLYSSIMLFTFFSNGNFSFNPTQELMDSIFGVSDMHVSNSQVVEIILLLPLALTVGVSIFELGLSLIIGSIYSFCFIVTVLIISAYYTSPLLFGNYLMLLRNSIHLENGVLTNYGFFYSILIGILGYFMGALRIKKLDIY